MASPAFGGVATFTHLKGVSVLEFSFKVPAFGAVSVIRDGKGSQVASVSAYASGVYTVTFRSASPGVRLPRQLSGFGCSVSQPAAGTGFNVASVVTDSYNASAGTVQVVTTSYAGAGALAQPQTGAWVSVRLVGPVRDDLKDPA